MQVAERHGMKLKVEAVARHIGPLRQLLAGKLPATLHGFGSC